MHNLSVDCGMLVFEDSIHFQWVYDCLDAVYENHNQLFIEEYGSLSEEDYNDEADSQGWTEEQPLLDFEDALGHNSYRKKFDDLEDVWLANGADFDYDPDDENCIDDPILATLLNENGAFVIGNIVHFVDANCEWWYLENFDCQSVEDCILDPNNCEGIEKAAIHPSVGVQCFYNEPDADNFSSSTRKVKIKVRHSHNSGGAYSSPTPQFRATQRCYRKKLGVWMRHRAQQMLYTQVNALQDDCSTNAQIDGSVSDRRWRRVFTMDMVYQGIEYPFFRECAAGTTFSNPVGTHSLKLPVSSSCN